MNLVCLLVAAVQAMSSPRLSSHSPTDVPQQQQHSTVNPDVGIYEQQHNSEHSPVSLFDNYLCHGPIPTACLYHCVCSSMAGL